jgi:hypothetical protein
LEIGFKTYVVESMIDSKLAVDGVVMSNSGKFGVFSHTEGVDSDVVLASISSQIDGANLVKVVASTAKGFEVHERDSHAHILMMNLCGLVPLLSLKSIF